MIVVDTRMRCAPAVGCRRYVMAVACAAVFVLFHMTTASAGEWAWKLPIPQGNTLQALAYGGGSYVAVGNGGSILVSDDGTAWSLARTGGAGEALYALAYGNGAFVAVGAGGTVLRSTDGRNWTASTSATETTLRAVAYGSSGFVACGELTLVTSADGIEWTEIDTGVEPGIFGPSFQNVAFGNGQYVVWIDVDPITSTSSSEVLTSADAVQWAHLILGPFPGLDPVPLFHRGFLFADGRFVALTTSVNGVSVSLTSSDGANWTAGESPMYEDNFAYFKSGAFDAATGRYIAIANLNDPPPRPDAFPIALSSADGLVWTTDGLIDRIPLNRLAAADGSVFGLPDAGGGLYVANGALNWTAASAVSPAWRLSSIAEGDAAIVAAGNGPLGGTENVGTGTGPMLIASFDGGETWTAVQQSDSSVWGGGFGKLVLGATHFVAAGFEHISEFISRPVVYSSPDGEVWTKADLSAATDLVSLTGAAYGNDIFVATGNANTDTAIVLISTDDGVSWQQHTTNVEQPLGSIVFAGDAFAAVSAGFSTSVYFSSDAITWSEAPTGTDASYLIDIAYHAGTYAALGTTFVPPGESISKVVVSTDGVAWETIASAPTELVSLASGADGFIATGSNGRVFQSSDARTWSSSWSGSGDPVTTATQLTDGRIAVATVKGGVLIENGDSIFSDGFDSGSSR